MVFKQKKLFWQIFPANIAIILVSITIVAWSSAHSFDRFYISDSATDLVNRAYLIQSQITALLESRNVEKLRRFTIESGRSSGTRITVIAADGRVLADSNENPEKMDNHRSRPEIDTAFSGLPGTSLRFSNTLGVRMLYSAIPLEDVTIENSLLPPDSPVGAVLRLAIPVSDINSALRTLNIKILGSAIVAVLAAFCVTLLVSRNISRPLEDMTRSAEHYSSGDFSQRMVVKKTTTSREVATLATAMDKMADQLDEKINTIINQRNQLETVFSSMVEAVIAVDRNERIISINKAAARMFNAERRGAEGRLVHEIIRNVDLHHQIEHILKTEESFEDEIILNGTLEETFLQTNVVSLYSGTGAVIGVLVVLNDVTRLRRLERVRSDFVANVSHELRTPITSIRGYVETLLDGAIDDKENAVRFLEIVLHQSEQLNEIIDDLLALSRIEKDAADSEIRLETSKLRPVLEAALQTCRHKAEQRRVDLVLDCPAEITLKMNKTLLEQAIVNLLVNGITYSEEGGEVTLRARLVEESDPRRVKISVIDRGVGIAKEHLPRLFERFYRSDRARSRKAGGTGLGLSIVKHIVQAHGGSVEISSTPGKGSEFMITLDS